MIATFGLTTWHDRDKFATTACLVSCPAARFAPRICPIHLLVHHPAASDCYRGFVRDFVFEEEERSLGGRHMRTSLTSSLATSHEQYIKLQQGSREENGMVDSHASRHQLVAHYAVAHKESIPPFSAREKGSSARKGDTIITKEPRPLAACIRFTIHGLRLGPHDAPKFD